MKEPTAMRLAFEKAWLDPKNPPSELGAVIRKALVRGVGLATRKQMWSVTRGGR